MSKDLNCKEKFVYQPASLYGAAFAAVLKSNQIHKVDKQLYTRENVKLNVYSKGTKVIDVKAVGNCSIKPTSK